MKENQRRDLSAAKKSMSQEINTEDVRFNEIKTNRVRRIRFNYKDLLQSMSQRKLTFYSISFKKTLVSATKL